MADKSLSTIFLDTLYLNVNFIFRHKRQAPYMIFPEILVIVDYDGYR